MRRPVRPSMLWLALPAAAVALALAACAAPGHSLGAGGRYVDPYTCEIKNKREKDPPYDPDCIRAAQASALAAARQASRSAKK